MVSNAKTCGDPLNICQSKGTIDYTIGFGGQRPKDGLIPAGYICQFEYNVPQESYPGIDSYGYGLFINHTNPDYPREQVWVVDTQPSGDVWWDEVGLREDSMPDGYFFMKNSIKIKVAFLNLYTRDWSKYDNFQIKLNRIKVSK